MSTIGVMREVIDSLKPFRPPTAPSSDLEKERKEITEITKRNLYFIQFALLLVVLVLLSYVLLPFDSANLIAFLLLCVGIGLGFFLRR
jgi:pilus assembly protein TadC